MNEFNDASTKLAAALEAWGGDTLSVPTLIVIALIVTFAADVAQRAFFGFLRRKARVTTQVWDDALAAAAGWPLSILLWTAGLSVAVALYGAHTDVPLPDVLSALQAIAVVFAVTWFAARFVGRAEQALYDARSDAIAAERGQLDRTTVRTVGRLLRALIVITGVIVAMHTLGLNIAGILAFGGIGGIAVGLAARDLLSNFFGGLSVFMDRPFVEGDWISSPEKDIEGRVESIGWRLSMIRRADKSVLYVPNAIFLSVPVRNISRMSGRRFDKRIAIRFDDLRLVPEIVRDIRSAIESDPDVDAGQGVVAALEEFTGSGGSLRIIAFTGVTNFGRYTELQQRLLLAIERALEANGARLAYPTTTFEMVSDTDFPRPAHDEPAG